MPGKRVRTTDFAVIYPYRTMAERGPQVYRPETTKMQIQYWTEYNTAVHLLIEKCAEIMSDRYKSFLRVKIAFNGNQLSCLSCGHHHDVYESKCPKCFKGLAIERDEAITIKNYWESLSRKLENELQNNQE